MIACRSAQTAHSVLATLYSITSSARKSTLGGTSRPSALSRAPLWAQKQTRARAANSRITRWEHEYVVDAVQARLDKNPNAMRTRRETVEHPFGTLKMWMGATHFLMKTLPNVATEMALHVLAYNLTRVMNIVGIKPLLVAIRA